MDAPSKWRYWIAGLLGMTALVFAFNVTFDWVYDDWTLIVQNSRLTWENLGGLLTRDLWDGSSALIGETQSRFYRPLTSVWLLTEKTIFGLSPGAFHLVSIALHLVAVFLFLLLSRQVLNDENAALFAAAIFALHPLQVEAVSWVSAQDDLLSACFFFASLYMFVIGSGKQQLHWHGLSMLFLICALACKERTAVLPVLMLLILSTTAPAERKRGYVTVGSAFLITCLWFFWRTSVLGSSAVVTDAAASASSVIATAAHLLSFYASKMVAPFSLGLHYEVQSAQSLDLMSLFVLVIVAGVAFALWKKRRERGVTLFAVGLFLLPLVPTLNVRWLNRGDMVHDRYAYLSVSGFALLVAILWVALRPKAEKIPLAKLVPLLLILVLAFGSMLQAQYWSNDVYLFRHAVEVAPKNHWAHYNLGVSLAKKQKFAEAAQSFEQSNRLNEGWMQAGMAGMCWQEAKEPAKAEPWLRSAVRQKPDFAEGWLRLGRLRLAQQDADQAVEYLRRAVSLTPEASGYNFALGEALERTGRLSEAADLYSRELTLNPQAKPAQEALRRLGR